MTPRLPDWMFAAFAIGAWELSELLVRRWHLTWSRTGAIFVICVCMLVLGVRYIYRLYRRLRYPQKPDPDEWKNY